MCAERLFVHSLADKARRRRASVKRRLAASIDLLALIMEVGGNFHDGLVALADDAGDHPLGQELQRVVADIRSGRSRKEALYGFAGRAADEDVRDLVFAIVKGEELGTPLASILTNQAEQMRFKRSQWAEKATQEAQVTLVFPAMLIMIGCLILVAAPFILTGLYAYQE
jgi:tight adherence protein C